MRIIPTRHSREVRRRAVAYCQFLFGHRNELPYAEIRPMRSFPTPMYKVPAHPTDCSESSAIILNAAGAPTPYVVNDLGYTGTMLATLKRIRRVTSRRGDLAVFVHPDRPNGDHVVVLTQGGLFHRDPTCFSHGSPGAWCPTISAEAQYHPGCTVVYLRAVPLDLKRV